MNYKVFIFMQLYIAFLEIAMKIKLLAFANEKH